MSDLFEAAGIAPPPDVAPTDAPLADRLRPRTLGEVVGQDHLLGEAGRSPGWSRQAGWGR
jgi:putative ATPase